MSTSSLISLPSIYQSSFRFKDNSSPSSDYVSLHHSKILKKQADQEAMKIQNRILFFKQEEQRLAKKIKETDERAFQIYQAKCRQAKKVKGFFTNIYDKKAEREQIKSQVQPFTYDIYRAQIERCKEAKKSEITRNKLEAQTIKECLNRDMNEVRSEKELRYQYLKDKVKQVQSQEFESYLARNKRYDERRFKVREEVIKEAEQVYQEKMMYDERIRQLEQQEMDALTSLQSTQRRQEVVLQKYKEAKQLRLEDVDQNGQQSSQQQNSNQQGQNQQNQTQQDQNQQNQNQDQNQQDQNQGTQTQDNGDQPQE